MSAKSSRLKVPCCKSKTGYLNGFFKVLQRFCQGLKFCQECVDLSMLVRKRQYYNNSKKGFETSQNFGFCLRWKDQLFLKILESQWC